MLNPNRRTNRRAVAALTALAALVTMAVVPATAAVQKKPPRLDVSNRGKTITAALGSYSWCYPSGNKTVTCSYVDGYPPPKSKDSLGVAPGDRIVLNAHSKISKMSVGTYDYSKYPNDVKPTDSSRRVWTLKIAKWTGRTQNLLATLHYANGNDAQFGFRIRKIVTAVPR